VIAAVVKLALRRAVEALPFGAFGVRCHALPIDEELAACLEGVRELMSEPGFEEARCVVGSTGVCGAPPPRTTVLQSDLAAAEATRIRDDPGISATPGFRLIYLNSGSTPGEAGLEDVLVEVRAQALARFYAETAGLPLLAEAGGSSSRPIKARLEDTTVATLARYAETARAQGELVALPTLGFLPRSLRQDKERPSPQWVSDFDTITSGKLIEPLVNGVRALEGLSPEARERLAAALRRVDGLVAPELAGGADPIRALVKLAAAARRFALGQEQNPATLCGLSRRLLDVLRSAERIEALAAEPGAESDDERNDEERDEGDDEDDDAPPRPVKALSEERILADLGPEGLRGKLERFEIDDGALAVGLRRGDDEVVAIAPEYLHAISLMTVQDAPDLHLAGAAVEVTPEAAVLADAKPTKFKVRFTLAKLEDAQEQLRSAIGEFLERRKGLLAAVAALLPAEEEERFSPGQRSLFALEAIPLTCLANATPAAEAYVAAYVSVMERAFKVQVPPPDAVEKWLTHLDTALALDANQNTVAARLQPLHPLRIARTLLWLEKRSEPPLFPSVIVAMTGYAQAALYPHGERYCYHARPKAGPSREGVEAAVEDGLAAVWSLLAPQGLMAALDIELVDVVSASSAIETLFRAAAERFAADASVGAGVHLRVRCAYSEAHGPSGISCPRVDDLAELSGVAGAVPGNGVTVEIMPKPVQEGGAEVHLSVQAVEAPFHGLPPSAPAGWGAKYIPGQSGNIIAVELTGNPALEGYRRLLSAYNKDTTATFDPGLDHRGLGKALVKTFVACGGWPVKPTAEDSLLSYDVVGPHVIATIADGRIFDAEVARRLAEFSAAGAAAVGDLKALREGMLGLFPCRNFLADLLSDADPRHSLGWLGILRAFRDARSGGGEVSTLVLSLDSPEGRSWVRSTASVFGTDEGRADLLVLEADLKSATVTRVRAVELKARTSAKQLTSKAARAKLATQALVTATRLRKTLGDDRPRRLELRDQLRRLLWLGAGQQRAALLWKPTLEAFDAKLLAADAVEVDVKAECWLVPEEPWVGDDDTEETMPALDAGGTPIPNAVEAVRVRVLQAVSRREPEVAVAAVDLGAAGAAAAPPPVAVPPPSAAPPPAAPASRAPVLSIVTTQPTPAPLKEEALPIGPSQLAAEAVAPYGDKARVPAPPVGGQDLAAGATAASFPGASPPGTPRAELSPDGLRVVLGQVQQGAAGEAIWLPNRTDLVTHFNVGITGTMGSGKTQFTKSLLTQIYRGGADNPGGRPPGMLIFDYKGDYVDVAPGGFAHAVGARVLKPHNLPINPLRLRQPETALDLKLATRQFVETIRTIATATGDVQRLGMIQAIEGCLKDAGIDDQDPTTWTKPFPTLKDLHARLKETEEVEGVPFAVIHDLADFEIFAPQDPGVALDGLFDGVTVIDLRPLAGAEKVIRAVISFFMNAMFAGMIQQGESKREARDLPGGGSADVRQIRRLLLVDEADDFIGLDLPSLKNVMQQGRAFGYGVILSTQFLHHFDGANSPLKPLIGTWVLHRMADVAPTSLRNLFGLSNDEGKALANSLSGLEVHTSMCFGLSNKGLQRRLTRVRDLPFFELLAR
jgi:hypothetical protein